jgi:hypothetical protein
MKIRDSILLVLGSGVAVISFALIGFAAGQISDIEGATSHASSDVLVAQSNQNLESIAIGIRDSLDSQMRNQYQMVRSWAETPTLVEASRAAGALTREALFESWSAEVGRTFVDKQAVGDGNSGNDIVPAASDFLAELSKTNPYPELFTTDSRGYVVAAGVITGDFDQGPDDWRFFEDGGFRKHKPEPGGEGWFRKAANSKSGMYISSVSWDESSKTWGIEIISQIRDPKTQAYLGQLKAVFNYGKFVDRFVATEELGVYEVKVVSTDGTIVATSLGAKDKVNSKTIRVDKMGYVALAKTGQPHGFVARAEVDENQESVYAGYAMSKDVNQHIVVVTKKRAAVEGPIESFTASLRGQIRAASQQLQRNMILVGSGVGIAVFLLALMLITAKISVPIGKLTQVSAKLAKGEIDGLAIDVSGNDEIGQFGESFKGVLVAFQLLMDEVEQNRK